MRNSNKSYTYTVAEGHAVHMDEKYNPMVRNHRYFITCECGYEYNTTSAVERNAALSEHAATRREQSVS